MRKTFSQNKFHLKRKRKHFGLNPTVMCISKGERLSREQVGFDQTVYKHDHTVESSEEQRKTDWR